MLGVEERIAALEEENRRLRDDNEKMLNIIDQMRRTINRLLDRCLSRTE